MRPDVLARTDKCLETYGWAAAQLRLAGVRVLAWLLRWVFLVAPVFRTHYPCNRYVVRKQIASVVALHPLRLTGRLLK